MTGLVHVEGLGHLQHRLSQWHDDELADVRRVQVRLQRLGDLRRQVALVTKVSRQLAGAEDAVDQPLQLADDLRAAVERPPANGGQLALAATPRTATHSRSQPTTLRPSLAMA